MFNKYYEDELSFLREMGREFAAAHPAQADFLANPGDDPDVERLLEGFAFLTGRLRQKLDDEIPELTQSLMQLLWPHYLRPVPAMSVIQFEPVPQLVREPQSIPRGTEVDSVPVEGTSCRFRTAYDVQLLPLAIETVEVERPAGAAGDLKVAFRIASGVKVDKLPLQGLRLFLHGDPVVVNAAYLQLTRRVRRVIVRAPGAGSGAMAARPAEAVKPIGFAVSESLLPYPPHAFPGYRLLQEYFALPQKFIFLEIAGLPPLAGLGVKDAFEILFEFDRAPEGPLRLTSENVRLHCTPVVNLFSMQSDPIRVDHQRVEYLLRPGSASPGHHEIFSIESVKGWAKGTSQQREYPSFHSFRHATADTATGGTIYYHTRLRNSVTGQGMDTYLSFITGDQKGAVPQEETVVADLICSNRHLPAGLRAGDINKPTGSSPEFAKFRNISTVTESVTPPLGGDLHWRMISNMSLSYLSLTNADALRSLLDIYNLQALQRRQAARENELRLAGIVTLKSFPEERIWMGSPVRGRRIEIDMKEENFTGEGGMVLFASVLNEFFSLYCTLNSFTHLVVRGVKQGETYSWNPRIGQQPLV